MWNSRRYYAVVAISACVGTIGTTTLSAQSPASGDKDPYARYVRPGQCKQAVMRLKDSYWRARRPDTVMYAPATDSVPQPALQELRTCASRFNVANVPERDLLGLAQMYLWTGQNDLAQAAVDRLLSAPSQTSDTARGWTLQRLISSVLSTSPVRYDQARKYLAQLDSLGTGAGYSKVSAHQMVSGYTFSIGDVPAALAEANSAVAYSRQLPENEKIDWAFSLARLYGTLADPTSVISGGEAALEVFGKGETDLLPIFPQGSMASMTIQQTLVMARTPFTLLGQAAVPVNATHWYNTGTDTSKPPVAGQVTLLQFVSSSCGGRCYPGYATLRRLQQKYGASGLKIVLMSSTYGYFRNQPQKDPAREAEQSQGYFLNFLKLPAVVALEETLFSHRPDGRRVNDPGLNLRNYSRGRTTILVGKDKKIRLVTEIGPDREQLLEQEIEKALQ